jgi:hypothetical protein
VGIVYVAAIAPDPGESVSALIKDPPAGALVLPILPPQHGFLLLDRRRSPHRSQPTWMPSARRS